MFAIEIYFRLPMNNVFKIILTALTVSLVAQASSAQTLDTLKLDVEAYEKLFLEKNLSIIAQQLSIAQEEALLIQERIWNNPSVSFSDANLWIPSNEPSVQQFEVALETLIQTAGKRKNRIRMQELSGEMAIKEYEMLLRQLKKEVRTKLAAFVYFQEILPVYHSLHQNIEQILQINKEQAAQRTYPREEFLRLQTLKLELTKEIFDLTQEKRSLQSDLLQYIQLSPSENLYIESDENNRIQEQFLKINLADLNQLDKRPDIQRYALEKERTETAIKLARSEAFPDFALEASYNRFDGLWKDYIGFGISFDLPIFNRNQGEIRYAKEEIKIQETKQQQFLLEVQHELENEYQKLEQLLAIRNGIEADYRQGLEAMLNLYTQEYKDRNINLLTFLDIQEAYLQGQDMLLTLEKEIVETWESLQYQIGSEN